MRPLMTLGLAVFALACGGSNPGSGTKTLYVKAQAFGDGRDASNSLMAVEVREGSATGNTLTDAVVTITGDKTGELALPWQGVVFGSFHAGSYAKPGLVWDTGWRLSVKRGSDQLDGYLVAPGFTTLTAPIAGSTFARSGGVPLNISWKDEAGRRAETVEIQLDKAKLDQIVPDDKGTFPVEVNRLATDSKEKISVSRSNEVVLAGGVPGSVFSARTGHEIEINVIQ